MACGEECTKIFVTTCKTLTATFGLISCSIIFYLIFKHAIHFTNPFFQKKIVSNQKILKISKNSHSLLNSFLQHQCYDWITACTEIQRERSCPYYQSNV